MGWSREIEDIHAKRKAALEQGGAEAVARQHAQGRLTVRERIDGLVDADSFREHGRGAGGVERNADGTLKSFTPANFVVGMGRIDGRLVAVGGEDFTVRGGSPNAAGLRKSVYIEDLALQYRVPLIRLHEGGGGSVTGAGSGGPVGEPLHTPRRFASVAECMGAVPVASAALGPVAGLPASRLVAAHFAVMTKGKRPGADRRPGGRQTGARRRRDQGGAGRRPGPCKKRRHRQCRRGRSGRAGADPALPVLSAAKRLAGAGARGHGRRPGPRRRGNCAASCPRTGASSSTCAAPSR